MHRLFTSSIFTIIVLLLPNVSIYVHSRATDSLDGMLHDMKFCFIQPGNPSSPTPMHVPGLGNLLVTELCCTKTVISGLHANSEIVQHGNEWKGATRLTFKLDEFSTQCRASWVYPSKDPNNTASVPPGTFEVDVGRVSESSPFISGSVDIKGSWMQSDELRFPFPRKTKGVECSTDLKLLKLRVFSQKWVNDLLTSGIVQKFIRRKICGSVREELRNSIDSSLADFRKLMLPMMKHIAPDLSPPVAPAGSGSSVDLLSGSLPKFSHHLLRQGLTTGGLEDLVERITGGTGSLPLVFRQEYKVVEADLDYPTNASVNISVASGGMRGIRSLRALDLAPTGRDTMAFQLTQDKLDMHLELRARVGSTREPSSSSGAMKRISDAVYEVLIDRFMVLLKLSDIDINVRAGLLLDKERVAHLLQSQSWFTGACAPTMVQTANVTGIDVRVTIEDVFLINGRWESQLELDVVKSINKILGYFKDHRVRRTVTRLMQAYLADKARDMVNSEIADMLETSRSQSSCVPKFGIGDHTVSHGFVFIAFVAIAAAMGFALFRYIFRYGEKVGKRKHVALRAFCLALGGISMVNAGLLGFPFRAGFRLHNGGEKGDSVDSMLTIFTMGMKDEVSYIPFVVTMIGFSVIAFGTARFVAITLAMLTNFSSRSSDCVRWFSAMGSWDLALVFFVGMQVTGLYTKVLEFGDSYADMGVELNAGFYFMLVGFLLIDLASFSVYQYCCVASAKSVVATNRQQKTNPAEPQAPHPEALVGLALSLLGLVLAPGLTLWSHTYKGALGHVLHYQSNTRDRSTFLIGILWHIGEYLVEPWSMSLGAFILQVILILHVMLAPIFHAAMALLVGIALYQDRRRDGPKSSGSLLPTSTPPQVVHASSARSSSPAGNKRFLDDDYVNYLVLARMWSGADAFAFFVFIFSSQIGSELQMLTKDMCEPLAPALGSLEKMGHGRDCYTADVSYGLGIYVLFFSGIAARIFAERCAHGPMRAARHCALFRSRDSKDQLSSDSSTIALAETVAMS